MGGKVWENSLTEDQVRALEEQSSEFEKVLEERAEEDAVMSLHEQGLRVI